MYTEEEKEIIFSSIKKMAPEEAPKLINRLVEIEKESIFDILIEVINTRARDERDIVKKIEDLYTGNILKKNDLVVILSKIEDSHDSVFGYLSEKVSIISILDKN